MAAGFAPFRQVCFPASSADETTGQPKNCTGYPYLVAYITGAGTTSSGIVTFEEADYDPNTGVPYGGTWSAITTVDLSSVSIADATKAIHFTVAAYAWVRARISTVIGGGGTIAVVLSGSGS